MSKKELTRDQLVDEFFKTSLWFVEWPSPIRLTGVTVKIEPTGYLLILKGITAEGPVVAFKGARSLWGACTDLRTKDTRYNITWRPDKYALDEK